jgi:hypothetical protein
MFRVAMMKKNKNVKKNLFKIKKKPLTKWGDLNLMLQLIFEKKNLYLLVYIKHEKKDRSDTIMKNCMLIFLSCPYSVFIFSSSWEQSLRRDYIYSNS